LGIGYSTAENIVLSAGVSQQNIFGTGNALSFQVNTGSINQTYSLSYTNPYFTDDGVSRGFDIYRRDTDVSDLSVASYSSSTLGVGLRFGVPVTEYDTINYGIAYEQTTIGILPDTPQRYIDFVNTFGETTNNYLGTAGWARDQRDSAIYPTAGYFQRLNSEIGLPGGDLTYYRLTYQHQWYYPLTQSLTLFLNGQIGYGEGYDNKPLPFFKNFYAGGVNSVRGYATATIGPKDSNGDALGGKRQLIGNFEVLFPFPGLEKDKSVRLATFVDAGFVGEKYDTQELRYSAGVAFAWYSPVGPMKISWAKPINPRPDDEEEPLQFTLGTLF
jgi:outer membrane protein insertion porin family